VTEGIIAGIRARHHDARVIAIVDGLTDVQGLSLLRLGVKGMVRLKQASHMRPAVKAVARGGMWVPRHLISKFLDSVLGRGQPRPLPQRLSPRERQVLDGIVKNLSNKEISVHLNISESTVKFHLAHLFDKFGVRRRADLIIQSVQEPAALIH
jgi:DNA-binding NarL/FixJ family response regulator